MTRNNLALLQGTLDVLVLKALALPEEERAGFIRRATERLDALPGVVGASPDLTVPFWTLHAENLRAPDLDSLPRLSTGFPALHAVDHDFFGVMGLEIRRGRGLLPTDVRGAPRAVVVNETMASTLWPRQDPLGKCLIIGSEEGEPEPPCAHVVGVVENTRSFRLVEEASMHYYVPLAQELVVAAIGLYSMLAFGVAQRRLELGIRAALGASRERIVSLVLGRALRLVGAGVLLGLGVVLLAGRRVEPLLFQVSSRDPVVLAGVAAVLLLVAAAAGLLPAWRATRVEPGEALRAE